VSLDTKSASMPHMCELSFETPSNKMITVIVVYRNYPLRLTDSPSQMEPTDGASFPEDASGKLSPPGIQPPDEGPLAMGAALGGNLVAYKKTHHPGASDGPGVRCTAVNEATVGLMSPRRPSGGHLQSLQRVQ
jgi:hypothetical protein